MKKTRKDIEISELIYKSLRGETNGDEEDLLKAWCLDTRNMELFRELKESDELYEELSDMQNIDTEYAFQKISTAIRRKKRNQLIAYITGIAAILLIGLIIVPVARKNQNEIVKKTPVSSIPKVSTESMATLITSAGKIVYLEDSIKQLSWDEKSREQFINQLHTTIPSGTLTQNTEYNILTTSRHGNIRVTLNDGSHVLLNAESELKYPNTFEENQRIVYLKGEAFFEVAQDSAHPFIVHTATAQINVLGTCFNVNADENSCITTLIEGCVRMKSIYQDSVELFPGQQGLISQQGDLNVCEVDTRYYTGWINNTFAFKETPLKEIVRVLEKWYHCHCYFEKPETGNLTYTAIIKRYPDLDPVLKILEGTGELRFIPTPNGIMIKEK